jgi:nucleotide-binding universal stress UspA family protein
MHRVIIPVDFSETALNAARFTAQMLAGKKDALAILYHSYETAADADICMGYLESLKKEFLQKGVAEVEYVNEMGGSLIENIARLSQTRTATLIVMGITGRTTLGQTMIGSNTLKMVESSLVPVLIIPPDAIYTGIKNVAFASDFRDVVNTTPVDFIKSVLEMFNPMLHIVNVDPEHYVSITEEYQQEKDKLQELFNDYEVEFYFIGMNDFFEAMDNFIRDYKVDMLLTVPRFHRASSNLFKGTHTKKLAYHSHIPLLAAHQ